MTRLLVAALGVIGISGCAPTSLYHWGDYETSLYKHYKAPDESTLVADLEKLIADAERRQRTVPPGIFAELGYLYVESGDFTRAIDMFRQEKSRWPESTVLMDVMILRSSEALTRGPQGADE